MPLAIAPALGVGAAGLSKSGSRGGGGGGGGAADIQARIAEQLFGETAGARGGLVNEIDSFFNSGDPFSTPQGAGIKDIIESQFGRARENVIAGTPEGGGLTAALAELERGRASNLVQGAGELTESNLGRAERVGFGTAGQSLAGLGSSAATQAQIKAAEDARQSAKNSNLGAGLGAYLGSK